MAAAKGQGRGMVYTQRIFHEDGRAGTRDTYPYGKGNASPTENTVNPCCSLRMRKRRVDDHDEYAVRVDRYGGDRRWRLAAEASSGD
jgi:hypothetical protein